MRLARLLLFGVLFSNMSQAQDTFYLEADPFYLLQYEYLHRSNPEATVTTIRPFLHHSGHAPGTLKISNRSRLYYNDNVPNLENTAELFVGKGFNAYNSLRMSFSNSWIALQLEPYVLRSQNQDFVSYHVRRTTAPTSDEIVRKYQVLNDGPGRGVGSFTRTGLRESFFFAHYKGMGVGFGNQNLWWGPGYHSSLNMTNNTTGIPHLTLGTMKPQNIWGVQADFRYHFAVLDRNIYEPFFAALTGQLTFPGSPQITIGGSRTFVLGGTATSDEVDWQGAAMAPFQVFFKKTLSEQTGESDPYQQDDQTLSLFVTSRFPSIGLFLFAEYGWNDHRWDWYDFRAEPDHSGASVIGLRKYGLYDIPQLMFGFEYANLRRSSFYPQRGTPDWYGRKVYDYSTYDGRRFAAHSGSDSDDLILYLAWLGETRSVTMGFDYERHGIIYSVILLEDTNAFHFPETKLEFRLDLRQKSKWGWLYAYYEYEYAENLGSPAQRVSPRVETPERKANVFGLGVDLSPYSFKLW